MEVLKLLQEAIGTKHLNYAEKCDIAEKIRVHSEGRVPTKLITERRPSEPDSIKDYRQQLYIPITQHPISKVLNSLEKIRRSSDWVIQYCENLPAIKPEESMKE